MPEDQVMQSSVEVGKFRLRDLEFDIERALIGEALYDTKPRWTVYITTKERSIFDFRWAPNIGSEADVLVDAPPFSEIVGTTVEVPLAYDYDTDEPFFIMYVFKHLDVFNSKITFLERNEGKFLIHWRGLCHVRFDEKYGSDVPFELKAWFDIDSEQESSEE